ncbi:TPM domain-containing protein [Bacteroidota bacterium]
MAKIKIQRFRLIVIFILLVLTFSNYSQAIPDKPVPPRLVNDYANFLSTADINQLEDKLVTFNNETSTQIAVVIIKSLEGYDISDFAFQLGEKWGVGQKGLDNGIVFLIKPKIGNERGEIFIAPGYGLEDVIPDAVVNRIIDYEIIPEFKNGNYFSGINKGTNTLMALAEGKFTPKEYIDKYDQNNTTTGVIVIFIIFIYFMMMIFGRSKSRHHSVGKNLPFWMLLTMLGSSSRSHSGSFRNFSSGGGGFGGGFGGGSFGGGGAGGSW